MHVSVRACRPSNEQKNERDNEDNHPDQVGSGPPLNVDRLASNELMPPSALGRGAT